MSVVILCVCVPIIKPLCLFCFFFFFVALSSGTVLAHVPENDALDLVNEEAVVIVRGGGRGIGSVLEDSEHIRDAPAYSSHPSVSTSLQFRTSQPDQNPFQVLDSFSSHDIFFCSFFKTTKEA